METLVSSRSLSEHPSHPLALRGDGLGVFPCVPVPLCWCEA